MKKLILALIFVFACQVPAPGYVTPSRAVPSVFKITTSVSGLRESTGTAWIAHYSHAFDTTYLITAGHVCNAEEPEREGERTYELESRLGKTYPAKEIKRIFQDRLDDRWPIDLCLLLTPGFISQALPIMTREPYYGEKAYYVGAPRGIWGGGEAPLYVGHYAGGELVAITGTGGASGSALFTEEGVFGVYVAGIPSYPGAAWFTSRENLLSFLDDTFNL